MPEPDPPLGRVMPCPVCGCEWHLLPCDLCDCVEPPIPGVYAD